VIDICRQVWAREAPLEHNGKSYQMPLAEEQGTGLGKALKIITHPPRPRIPIFVASLGPKNVEATAELAEGWLPTMFVPERASSVWGEDLARGEANRDASLGAMDIIAGGMVAIDPEDQNFYNSLFSRYGWEGEAHEIQQLYLAGNKAEAAAKVPDAFLEQTSLVGDAAYVKDRLAAYEEAGVTYLNVSPVGPDPLGTIRQLRELIG